MIVDKHQKPKARVREVSKPTPTPSPRSPKEDPNKPKRGSDNGLIEAFKAIKSIIQDIKKDPDDPNSPPLFRTVKLDNGQLSRIKNNAINREYGIAFPAVLIHFIDVYYTQGTSMVSEGKGTARIHYILNRLNNSDDEFETEGLEVYQRIVAAIEQNKSKFPALVSRFQLQYWDQPLTFDDGLQPYWIDYQIWFSDTSTATKQNYVDVYAITPPFTQHSDQNEIANPDNLPDSDVPKFEDCVSFQDFD